MRLLLRTFLAALLLLSAPFASANTATTEAKASISAEVYADKAFEHFYSAEFEQAVASYRKAIELAPSEPHYWYGLADSYLFQHLLQAGRLEGRLYSASNPFLQTESPEPDPKLIQAMWDALARARKICEERLKANPKDSHALYVMGLTYAVEANYLFQVPKKYLDSLRAGDKAKEHHERVRVISPENHDANLVIGVHEYAVGSIPAAVRWLFFLAGYSGSKERGVELIQDAMKNGKRTGPAALTLLALIYNREKMYGYSRQMWQHLVRFYPRNYLYQMELAWSFQQEGLRREAVEVYQDVARKAANVAPGYGRVDRSRLHFQIGGLLEESGKRSEALAEYQKVVAHDKTEAALLAQSYLRMAEIHRALNQREQAREMYERARRMPFPEVQRQAAARLRSLK